MKTVSLNTLADLAYDHAKFCVSEGGQVDPMVFWANKTTTMFPRIPTRTRTKLDG